MAVYGIQDTSSLEILTIIEWDGSSSISLLPGHQLYSGSLDIYTGSMEPPDPLTTPITGSFTGSYTGSFYGLVIGSGSFTGSLTGSLTGSVSGSDKMSFSTSANQTVLAGEMAWDDGNGTLDIGLKGGNINLAVGQQTFARCYNSEGTTLTKGTVVFISGSQGNRVAVKRADYSVEVRSSTTLGFVAETITPGAQGFVITNGVLERINTTGLIEGEILYLSSSGQYTHTKPVAPKHTVVLGYVERLHATVGSIYVKIDNGYELGELHNVLTNGVTNGDLLAYSGSVWTHSKQLSGSYGVTGSINMGTGSVVNPLLTGYYETMVSKSVANDFGGGIVQIDLKQGNVYKLKLDGSVLDFNIQNNPTSLQAGTFTLVLEGDGTARAFNWGTEVTWPNGAPAIVSGSGVIDVYSFVSFNSGTEYLGLVITQNQTGLS